MYWIPPFPRHHPPHPAKRIIYIAPVMEYPMDVRMEGHIFLNLIEFVKLTS